MKITNKLNLPEPIVKALSSDYKYTANRYSVSEMTAPIRQTILKRRNESELTEDAADRIWALLGTATHYIVEQSSSGENLFTEERLKEEVLPDVFLSGRIDLYDAKTKTLSDYKTASVWSFMDGVKPEWIVAQNCYRWLLEKAGFEVKRMEIITIYRDWSKGKAKQGGNYPPSQVGVYQIPFKTDIQDFVFDKIVKIESMKGSADLPMCTPEERWSKPTKYAVMKHGRKSAVKLYDVLSLAEEHARQSSELYIQERKGKDTRCEDYCSVCMFCDYWKEHYGKEETI